MKRFTREIRARFACAEIINTCRARMTAKKHFKPETWSTRQGDAIEHVTEIDKFPGITWVGSDLDDLTTRAGYRFMETIQGAMARDPDIWDRLRSNDDPHHGLPTSWNFPAQQNPVGIRLLPRPKSRVFMTRKKMATS